MIEAARRRGATAAPAGTPPAPVRPAAERDRREAARAQSPVTSVAAAEALEAAAEPVGDETRDAQRAAEVEGLMARLTEAQAAAERGRGRPRRRSPASGPGTSGSGAAGRGGGPAAAGDGR